MFALVFASLFIWVCVIGLLVWVRGLSLALVGVLRLVLYDSFAYSVV